MKKKARFVWGAVLFILLLPPLLIVLLYLPPVQKWVVSQGIRYVSKITPYTISYSTLEFKFPFDLSATDVVLTTPNDTIASLHSLYARVLLQPLFQGEVIADSITLKQAHITWESIDSSFILNTKLAQLRLPHTSIKLSQKQVITNTIFLSDGDVSMRLRPSPPDTTSSAPILWQFNIGYLEANNIEAAIAMDSATYICSVDKLAAHQGKVDLSTIAINVNNAQIDNGQFTYLTQQQHYGVNELGLQANDIYYQGITVKAHINAHCHTSFGVDIDELKLNCTTDSNQIAIQNLILRTPNSNLTAQLLAKNNWEQLSKSTSYDADIKTNISANDLLSFTQQLPRALLHRDVSLRLLAQGTLDALDIKECQWKITGLTEGSLQGELYAFATRPKEMDGRIKGYITLQNGKSLLGLIPDTTLRKRLSLPALLTAQLSATAQKGSVSPNITISTNNGSLKIDGTLHLSQQRYEVVVALDSFPIQDFLPYDSIANVSLGLTAKGKGYDPMQVTTSTKALLHIDSLLYRQVNYKDITLSAQLDTSHYQIAVVSNSNPLQLNMDAHGIIEPSFMSTKMRLALLNIDPYALRFTSTPFSLGMHTSIDLTYQKGNSISTSIYLDSIQITENNKKNNIADILLTGEANQEQSSASFQSRDMYAHLLVNNSIDSINYKIGKLLSLKSTEDIEMVPPFTFVLKGGKHNIIGDLLHSYAIKFDTLSLEASASAYDFPHLSMSIENLNAYNFISPRIEAHASLPPDSTLSSKIDLYFADLKFQDKLLGNIYTNASITSSQNTPIDAHIESAIDSLSILSASLNYIPKDSISLQANAMLNNFPLALINPFLPQEWLSLTGETNANIDVKGSLENQTVNGQFSFNHGALSSPWGDVKLNLSPLPLVISNSHLFFNQYSLTGYNDHPLYINGDVNFSQLQNITTDLNITATDFGLLNTPRSTNSLLFGKALIDLNSTLKGSLDNLSLKGDLRLLNGSDITYILKETPLSDSNKSQDIVTFISFSDTTQIQTNDTSIVTANRGMDIAMNIDIASQVKAGIYLSINGNNRIELQGGGSLSYTSNMLGDDRFTGRYTLSGGTVHYAPPIIGEKTFIITDGSYVEWSGNMLNPSFNITAAYKIRTQIEEATGATRMVEFEALLRITNTLEQMHLVFDIAAPNDMGIQNQLASLTPEQRATQAMNMLITNTYSGPGTYSKSNFNTNALNALVQKELNAWARNNIKGIDLLFGIDSYQEVGANAQGTRTDYTYNLSKSLFDEKVKVVIGGGFSPESDPTQNLKENFIDDISVEYMFNKRNNMYLKVFRKNNYESMLEGEVIQTGIGFVVRKKLENLRQIFKRTPKRATKDAKK